VQPFSFLPLFFWEKKNGVVSFSERKISAEISCSFKNKNPKVWSLWI